MFCPLKFTPTIFFASIHVQRTPTLLFSPFVLFSCYKLSSTLWGWSSLCLSPQLSVPVLPVKVSTPVPQARQYLPQLCHRTGPSLCLLAMLCAVSWMEGWDFTTWEPRSGTSCETWYSVLSVRSSVYTWLTTHDMFLADVLSFQGHVETIFDCKFKPDDPNLLATASFDGTIKIWDTNTLTAVNTSPGNEGVVYSLSWAPGSSHTHICTHTAHTHKCMWNPCSQEELRNAYMNSTRAQCKHIIIQRNVPWLLRYKVVQ